MNTKSNILLFFLGVLMISCTDCESLSSYYRSQECSFIINNKSSDIREFYKGKNPYTGKECNCKSGFRWYSIYEKHMNIGDTIIKKRGELFFTVHKSDTVLKFDWKCEGKTYK